MLRKILSLVSNYDKRFWDWMEGKSSPSRNESEVSGSLEERAKMLDRCLDAPSVKNEIPDPWDDPLM
jgi:hypothetical protein